MTALLGPKSSEKNTPVHIIGPFFLHDSRCFVYLGPWVFSSGVQAVLFSSRNQFLEQILMLPNRGTTSEKQKVHASIVVARVSGPPQQSLPSLFVATPRVRVTGAVPNSREKGGDVVVPPTPSLLRTLLTRLNGAVEKTFTPVRAINRPTRPGRHFPLTPRVACLLLPRYVCRAPSPATEVTSWYLPLPRRKPYLLPRPPQPRPHLPPHPRSLPPPPTTPASGATWTTAATVFSPETSQRGSTT